MLFGDLRQKKTTKSWYRYYPKDFWFQNVSETQKGSPTMFFGDLGQTISDGKTWHPPSYPYIFSILENFWNTTAFLHELFRYCETKNLRRKIVKLPHVAKKFRCPNFLNHWRVPHNNSAPWDKKVPQNRDTLLSKKFWYQNIPKTQNGSATMIFRDVRQKNSTKMWYPFYPRTFWCQKISETQGSPNETFRYCETKKTNKIVIPYSQKIFDTRTFLKQKSSATMFSALWDKKFPTEKRDIPFLSLCFFRSRNFLKHKRVPLRNFRYCEAKIFPRKIVKLP